MIETHPFPSFVPPGAKYLILGSFAAKQSVKGRLTTDDNYDFYYGVKRNQFWPILEEVYGRELKNTEERKKLLSDYRIGITDIIYQCEREKGSSLDANLKNIVYAKEEITRILEENQISEIFFTSRYVENKFRSNFKNIISKYYRIDLVTLPSPSSRYVRITKEQKIKRYKETLPQLA